MGKIFHAHVCKYQFLTPERLYGDYRQVFDTAFTAHAASVYFVVRCKAVQWLVDTFRIARSYQLAGLLAVDGTKQPVRIDMARFWHAEPSIGKHFENEQDMARYFMRRSDGVPWRWLPHDLRYKLLSGIDRENSEAERLVVDCALARNMRRSGTSRTDVYAYQAINYFDLPAPKLDIIYIGSSVSDTFDRVQLHERWGQMQAEKRRDEDLLVYFAEVDTQLVTKQSVGRVTFLERRAHQLSREDSVRITESALIHHFKPHYNEHNKRRPIQETKRVKRALVAAGYDTVAVEVMLDGSMGAIGTSATGYGEHSAQQSIAQAGTAARRGAMRRKTIQNPT